MSQFSDDTSLKHPSTPKLEGDAERVRREFETKIVELQDLLRATIKAVQGLGGSV